jgi:outer membrane protein OmpA-like peptidoglycan-associated protein
MRFELPMSTTTTRVLMVALGTLLLGWSEPDHVDGTTPKETSGSDRAPASDIRWVGTNTARTRGNNGMDAQSGAPHFSIGSNGGGVPLPITVYFDFDGTALRRKDMKALDELAAQMRTNKLISIEVVGYTDRIGEEAYNQALSARRAETVKEYLVQRGVSAAQIRTDGRGEAQPKAGSHCADMGLNLYGDLVKCLQSDRRVEIAVVGMT